MVGKKQLGKIIDKCIRKHGFTVSTEMLDRVKSLGYKFSTKGAISVSIADMVVPEKKYTLVKEAEANAAEDKKKQEAIEARNQADNLIYATEKSLKDLGDKVDPALKSEVEAKTEALKKAMEGNDTESIKKASDELSQASHKLAELLYKNAQAQQGAQQGGCAGGNCGGAKKDDDVVDADFTEVK